MDTTRELPPTSGKVFTRGIPSAGPRLRPSDCGPVRFWSWLVLAVSGVALNLLGASPFPELGIGVLLAASLFAPPLSEFQRTVHPRSYSSILVFVFLMPASLVSLAALNSASLETSRVIPPFRAALLAFWAWAAVRELLRYLRIRSRENERSGLAPGLSS